MLYCWQWATHMELRNNSQLTVNENDDILDVGMNGVIVRPPSKQKNICITFVQCWTNVKDVGPTLNKCFVFAEDLPVEGRR